MTNWGGVERMLVDFLIHASQEQVRHFLLSTSSILKVIQPVLDAQIPFFQPRRHFHYDPRAIVQMARWLRFQRVDVVHSYNAYANAWGGVAALIARVPLFLTGERGSVWWVRPPMAWLDRWAHHRAKWVVANSRASATILHLRYGIPKEKIRIVHNAVSPLPKVDTRLIRASLGIDSELIVGSVGRLDTPKDFNTLVDAAAIVLKGRRGVRFVLVGGGALERDLRERIHKLEIQDKFILTGWRKDARALVQAFDIFVSTSIHEAFGNAIVEAALAGKPVIASRVDGIPEVVLHKETGILLKPTESVKQARNPNATPPSRQVLIDGQLEPPKSLSPSILADTIQYLLDRANLRFEYGQAGRQRAENLFSISRYVGDLEKIYVNSMREKSRENGDYACTG